MKKSLLLTASGLSATLLLTACTGNIRDAIPDRRPDYRQSSIGKQLEVPPDLSSTSIDDQLIIPDFNPSAVATYQAYAQDSAVRNSRGYIEVLPELYGVNVVESTGELPYIVINADASTAWTAVKRYWENNGIRLRVQEPLIGLMETDWLENRADLPVTGFSGILGSIFDSISDTGERDRYRIQFSKMDENNTRVTIVYSQSVEKAQYERQSGKDPAGYKWSISDNDNPELQLEMTRRVALFVSAELRRQAGISNDGQQVNSPIISTELSILDNGQPALIIQGEYAQAWRILGIGLDNASFALENQDYASGSYLVRYTPQSDAKQNKQSFWSKLWGSDDNNVPENVRPQYQVRLSDQGNYGIAIVQDAAGNPVAIEQARAVLEAVKAAL